METGRCGQARRLTTAAASRRSVGHGSSWTSELRSTGACVATLRPVDDACLVALCAHIRQQKLEGSVRLHRPPFLGCADRRALLLSARSARLLEQAVDRTSSRRSAARTRMVGRGPPYAILLPRSCSAVLPVVPAGHVDLLVHDDGADGAEDISRSDVALDQSPVTVTPVT
jgi:hypothetical protein